MIDVSTEPMALYGALAALVVFGIFIGSWWWYGMRTYRVHRQVSDDARVPGRTPVAATQTA